MPNINLLNRWPCPLVCPAPLTIRHYRVTQETCDLWDIWSEWPPHLNGLLNYALVVANTNFHFLKPIFIPRQGDLFLYGTEALICPINRKGSWVGCLGWQRGWARTFFLSNFFPFQPFSFISDKNRLMNVPNSYFFLNIFKNRLKWIKNPNLHDSPVAKCAVPRIASINDSL